MIEATGCGMIRRFSSDPRVLFVHENGWLTTVIPSSHSQSLGSAQTLLIMVCWRPERSTTLEVGCRMAVEVASIMLSMSWPECRLRQANFSWIGATRPGQIVHLAHGC